MSSPVAICGVLFRGLETGTTLEVSLPLEWDDVPGGAPVAVPYGPDDGSLDALVMEGTFWAHATAALEDGVPPYGDSDNSMVLPVVSGGVALPGIVGTTPVSGFRKLSNVLMDDDGKAGYATQGRLFEGMDLVRYQLRALIPCDETNEAYSTVMPDFVASQFGTPSWEDLSVQLTGSIVSGSTQVRAANLSRQHGRSRKGTLTAHLTTTQADALIKWARAVRGDSVVVPAYCFGPTYTGETVTAVVRSCKLTHQGGHLWDAEVVLCLDNSTTTRPAIRSIVPQYFPSGVAGNVVISGSGFDGATTVTVGSVACVVASWTSGRLAVTVPSGAAGQYEVIVANSAGSSTGTLWRYDAGEITIGTGGTVMATTAVAVGKNQLAGLNASGDAVLADAVLGIVAIGFFNADAAVGAAVQINQTGHATPISGLAEGQPVYLGVAGGYVTAPPAGATISQQVGVGTATGVAVNPQQAVYL